MDAIATNEGVDADWVAAVTNEYSTPTRTAAEELDKVPGTGSDSQERIEGLSIEDLTDVTNGWFEVFEAAPDPALVCDALNDLLRRATPTTSAVTNGSAVWASVGFADSVTPAWRLAAQGAIALLEVIADIGVERIGLCSAANCVDVYIDRSPRRNRRYCSQLCQTRERVQRHRSRT